MVRLLRYSFPYTSQMVNEYASWWCSQRWRVTLGQVKRHWTTFRHYWVSLY